MAKRAVLLILMTLISMSNGAQVPQKFTYQAVVRNAEMEALVNSTISLRLSILEGSIQGPPVYVESHSPTTNSIGLVDLVIGEGEIEDGSFTAIPWGSQAYFLKLELDPSGGSSYQFLGTSQLISVPYALYSANLSSPTRSFTVQEEEGHPLDSALFEVRNIDGQVIFAVYPDGARVYVLDDETKGLKGSFAVGGYSRKNKGATHEFLHISPDSIRLYLEDNPAKGLKGTFAVGGYSRINKGASDHYFELKSDSAKFTMVREGDGGGNALSVITRAREGTPEEMRGSNLIDLTRDNYFIGHRAGEAMSEGAGNCFVGFESGLNTSTGYGNIFMGALSGTENTSGSFNLGIGYKAGMKNDDGINNVALGFGAGQEGMHGNGNVFIGADAGHNSPGDDNVFIGNGAGMYNSEGGSSVMIGAGAGHNAETSFNNIFIGPSSGSNNSSGSENVFIGIQAGFTNALGNSNTFIGHGAGLQNVSGSENVFIGRSAGGNNVDGTANLFIGLGAGDVHRNGNENVFLGTDAGNQSLSGARNVFIGTRAGQNNQSGKDNIFIGHEAGQHANGDGQLFIDLYSNNMEQALIFGDLYGKNLRVNHQLGIGMSALEHALEVAGTVAKTTPGDWLIDSDARIKTEIREIDNACGQIMQLRPVTYRYNDEWISSHPDLEDKTYYNFIAQEYREVFPGSVHERSIVPEGESDPLLQLDPHASGIVAIRAIQELTEENQAQQELIEALFERLDVLEQKLEAGGAE